MLLHLPACVAQRVCTTTMKESLPAKIANQEPTVNLDLSNVRFAFRERRRETQSVRRAPQECITVKLEGRARRALRVSLLHLLEPLHAEIAE